MLRRGTHFSVVWQDVGMPQPSEKDPAAAGFAAAAGMLWLAALAIFAFSMLFQLGKAPMVTVLLATAHTYAEVGLFVYLPLLVGFTAILLFNRAAVRTHRNADPSRFWRSVTRLARVSLAVCVANIALFAYLRLADELATSAMSLLFIASSACGAGAALAALRSARLSGFGGDTVAER
jgi:hypothetical protein